MSLRAAGSTREIIKALNNGPGAAKLPSNVSKIALTFASRGKNDSASARYRKSVVTNVNLTCQTNWL